MGIEKVVALFDKPGDAALRDLLQDESLVFWVDWREADEAIGEYCESVLQTGQLAAELVNADHEKGYDVFVQYGDRRLKVPLSYSDDDRHITLCALNKVLEGDFEVRFCIDSNGSDTLAFLCSPPSSGRGWNVALDRPSRSDFTDSVSGQTFSLTVYRFEQRE